MKILDRLPIPKEPRSLRFGDRHITLRRDQILVWVSVHLAGVFKPEEDIPKFPALLDTGNNLGFSVQDRHLRDWAGINSGLLQPLREIEVNGQPVWLRRAAFWLHPNIPARLDAAGGRPPFRLEMTKGIAVHSPAADPPGPRLPLMGLPALLDNDLDFWLDPDRRYVTVQPRSWRRSLMRLLCRL